MKAVLCLLAVWLSLPNFTFGQSALVLEKEDDQWRGEVVRPAKIKGVGVNKFDLLMQYLGTASEPAPRDLTRAMGKKSIIDAYYSGIPYFRVSASGYQAADLKIWKETPEVYWEAFDQMMVDLEKYQIRVILVLAWEIRQFALLENENLRDFILNPGSASQTGFRRFVEEVIVRYRDHPMLIFWELTNEWNLDADIDLDKIFNSSGNNFSTDELREFNKETAAHVKSLDSYHRLSSGYSLPRRAAEHLRRQPGWSEKGADWAEDSQEEFVKNLLDLHESFDIVSIHIYNACDDLLCRRRDNERLGWRGKDEAGFLDFVKFAADQEGKLLFIGEFNDVHPDISQDPNGPFIESVLHKIVELNIPYSAVWVWEFYQNHIYSVRQQEGVSLEPGLTDLVIDKIKEANRLLGRPVLEKEWPDTTPPQVLITYPFNGGTLDVPPRIAATATDNDRVVSIDFWLDNRWMARLIQPPYNFILGTAGLPRGTYRLKAVATDSSGNVASHSIEITLP